ncbi:MAG: undecaprenyl/decaprenyl-phosphate alpha-N-acetylglucosaminyl 1-phosphate transferase [Candidatus Omnitrophica bacterium]|nr:undecaprenyl/decaprenyl-phosphate alpha-N-acetylglucosaminyl 1-phosphate transferase [Candidatus Omnitrophota bacterium]
MAVAAIIISRKIVRKRKFLIVKNMPLIGGLSIGLAFFMTSCLVFGFYPVIPSKVIGILSACGLMLFFGVMDDVREMPALLKLILQVIAAGLVIFFGVRTNIGFLPETVNYALTLVWILVITNAVNLLDVTDGLAGGTVFLAGTSFFIVAVFTGDTAACSLLLCFLGGLAAFLLYNFPPAKIYMGNAGSHFLGFFLAVIAILLQGSWAGRAPASFSPLFILGLPIFYIVSMMWVHLQKGRSLFIKINGYPAGRTYASVYAQRMDLCMMLGFCFILCCAGVLVSRFSNPVFCFL